MNTYKITFDASTLMFSGGVAKVKADSIEEAMKKFSEAIRKGKTSPDVEYKFTYDNDICDDTFKLNKISICKSDIYKDEQNEQTITTQTQAQKENIMSKEKTHSKEEYQLLRAELVEAAENEWLWIKGSLDTTAQKTHEDNYDAYKEAIDLIDAERYEDFEETCSQMWKLLEDKPAQKFVYSQEQRYHQISNFNPALRIQDKEGAEPDDLDDYRKEFTSLQDVFAFRVVGSHKVPRIVELLIEDDGHFYHKTRFHVDWLDSLIKAATETKQLIENYRINNHKE
jgi:hypothetical protein